MTSQIKTTQQTLEVNGKDQIQETESSFAGKLIELTKTKREKANEYQKNGKTKKN